MRPVLTLGMMISSLVSFTCGVVFGAVPYRGEVATGVLFMFLLAVCLGLGLLIARDLSALGKK